MVIGGARGEGYRASVELSLDSGDMLVEDGDGSLQTDSFVPASRGFAFLAH